VVTHDSVVAQKANRVLHMMDGKIVNDEVILKWSTVYSSV